MSETLDVIDVIEADLSQAEHAAAVLALVDAYCRTPQGRGRPLQSPAREQLIPLLRQHPTTRIFLARRREDYVGIAVCFVGVSTFAAMRLINIHDIYVREELRGRGIARRLLAAVEQAAIALGCCKLTLEVMDANPGARAAYERCGFDAGVDGRDAHRFMNKRLDRD